MARLRAPPGPLDLDAAPWSAADLVAQRARLGAVGGWTPWQDARATLPPTGAWFALPPRWAVQLDAAIAEHGLGGGARSTAVTGSLGVSRLLRAPW